MTTAPPPADGFAYDAYISFSKEKLDKTWARKAFLPALKAAGLNVVSEDRFRPGLPTHQRDGAGRRPEPLHHRPPHAPLPCRQLRRLEQRPGASTWASKKASAGSSA